MNVDGTRGPPRTWHTTTQRLVVLTFATPEQAEAWDAAGRPIDLGLGLQVEVSDDD